MLFVQPADTAAHLEVIVTIYETLLHGIAMTSPLALSRNQDGGRMRYVCPHAIGYSKNDILNLFCYQYDGYSSSKLATVPPNLTNPG